MNTVIFPSRFPLTLGMFLILVSCQDEEIRPNIIFIMSDDHAEQAISSYGYNLIQTPNIDRLANEGMLFQNSCVTNSICAPSRAVMLTGKYSHLNGKKDNQTVFDGSQQTLPKLLQQGGYETAVYGKWHLHSLPTGFDNYHIHLGQGHYYNPYYCENGDTIQRIGYATEITTDKAISFLTNRKSDKPFCILVQYKAPHRNFMPPLKYLKEIEKNTYPLPETFWDDYETREQTAGEADMRIADMFLSLDMKLNPEDYSEQTGSGGAGSVNPNPKTHYKNMLTIEQLKIWEQHYDSISAAFKTQNLTGKELEIWKYQRYMRDYMGCVRSVDENVGRILDYLDENGLAENTIVVYTSDQGFYLGEHGWYDKRFMYEESLGMPLLVRYPGEIPSGEVNKELALNLDFAPTFLDYAGIDIPVDMQGKSLRNQLKGDETELRDAMYYHYYEYPYGWHKVKRHYGIRTKDYKLIHFYYDVDVWELYDLEKDPNELINQYDNPEYKEVVEGLRIRLKELQNQYQDTIFSTY